MPAWNSSVAPGGTNSHSSAIFVPVRWYRGWCGPALSFPGSQRFRPPSLLSVDAPMPFSPSAPTVVANPYCETDQWQPNYHLVHPTNSEEEYGAEEARNLANPHRAKGSVCTASKYHRGKKWWPDNGLRIRYQIEHFLPRAWVIPLRSDKIACCEWLADGRASQLATPLARGEEENRAGLR